MSSSRGTSRSTLGLAVAELRASLRRPRRARPSPAAAGRRVGMVGTFDVANYGDLLFPILAREELERRLGSIELECFSYHQRSALDWPFAVSSLSDLGAALPELDALIIGGGHIIRFDKEVAPGYAPPSPDIHHPTGYWLGPALAAVQAGVPVLWNAPSMAPHIPGWAEPLLELAISQSAYVAVRDEPTRSALRGFAQRADVEVIPDTVFGVDCLVDAQAPSVAFREFQRKIGSTKPYLLLQATPAAAPIARALRDARGEFADLDVIVVAVGPVNGDDVACLDGCLPLGAILVREFLDPLLLAEVIAHAAAVAGASLHLAITAAAFAVPTLRPVDTFDGKYSILAETPCVHGFDRHSQVPPAWIRACLSPRLNAAARAPDGAGPAPSSTDSPRLALRGHWDRIAEEIGRGRARSKVTPRPIQHGFAFWQALPGRIEERAARSRAELATAHAAAARWRSQVESLELRCRGDETEKQRLTAEIVRLEQQIAALSGEVGGLRQQVRQMNGEVGRQRAELAQREATITSLLGSTSWRLSAPIRRIAEGWRRRGLRRAASVIELPRLEAARLEREPFEWARVDHLYGDAMAQRLAAEYPVEGFKTVAGYDGEKGFEYEARSLVHMGAASPTMPETLTPAWQRLAADLVSDEYRRALSRLTGRDLAGLPIEVNVFHYGPGAWLGPHLDLPEKIVTHVLYFNTAWNGADGGCLQVLRAPDAHSVAAEIPPLVGSSAVLVRSDRSWHAVSPVVPGIAQSRRSVTVTFYTPGSVSTMWPPGETPRLHTYVEPSAKG